MTEPTIICPNCETEIKLTESLAAPLIASTRQATAARPSIHSTTCTNDNPPFGDSVARRFRQSQAMQALNIECSLD